MGLKKDIKEIKESLNTLNKEISRKANMFDKYSEYLSNVKLNVSKVNLLFDKNDASYAVKVEYDVPPVILYIDGDGKTITNERFKSMNLLGLTSLSDLSKIQEAIDQAKTKQN